MSQTAFQTMYRDELILGFDKRQALARHTVTTEKMIKGSEAIFLVGDSGGAEAVTRGVNGDIPTRANNLNQFSCPLTEWHDVPEVTGFNVFASQGNLREHLQVESMGVINRKIDRDIRDALSTTTISLGAAAIADVTLVTRAKTILANNFANKTGKIYAQITPAFHGYLMNLQQFTSSDYVQDKRFEGVGKDEAFDWYGVTYIVNPDLTGVGTASAECFYYNSMAIGHGCDKDAMKSLVGYDEKNDKSWARCSIFMGSKVIQPSGIIKVLHNDSALSA